MKNRKTEAAIPSKWDGKAAERIVDILSGKHFNQPENSLKQIMLREKSKIVIHVHKFLDIFITALAFIGAYFIKKYILPEPFQGLTETPSYYIVLLMIIIIWYICFDFFGFYTSYRKQTLGKILWNMIKAVSIGMLIMFLCIFILKMEDVSRIMMSLFYVLNITLLAICKTSAYKILTHYRQKGYNFRNILIN